MNDLEIPERNVKELQEFLGVILPVPPRTGWRGSSLAKRYMGAVLGWRFTSA